MILLNLKKMLQMFALILLAVFPSIVFAYSSYVIPGGENIGIHLETKYVTVVGFYKVENHYIGEESGFQIGDQILSIENEEVTDIDQMISLVDTYKDQENGIAVSVLRGQQEIPLSMSLQKDASGSYKTGIYVKDQINGIGTLTYVDPTTHVYGALGHEIADRNTLEKVELKEGTIFKSDVTNVRKSSDGNPGEKQAKFYHDMIFGDIQQNEDTGIFGTFTSEISSMDAIEVGKPEDVQTGKARIRTVLQGDTIEEFEIEILEINAHVPTKNILFQVTDSRLLDETGGIVAGMSGSPIIQNGKLIGAVTHVVVNDTDKGYGIFITSMLEEGEKSD